MADAYKVIQATTIPKATERLEDDLEGNPRYATQGVLYVEDTYVLESDITPTLREKAANGEFEAFLEPVSLEEAKEGQRAVQFSTFAPEHEVERVTLSEYGHDVLGRKQILEFNSAGADAAREAQEAAKENDADARPAITEQATFAEVESLADASREGRTVGAQDDPEYAADVDPETDSIQTMPSGVIGGAVKAAAEAGGNPLTATVATEDGAGKKAAAQPRSRPGKSKAASKAKESSSSSSSESKQD
jgi:hypothetical protein